MVRKNAKTTKVRVVYDASSKECKRAVSLNDCLHVGPSLTPQLFHVLLRFRERRVALVADIEKAFLNVEVDKCDRDALRFILVRDVSDEEINPVVYRFCKVVFGVNSSPFLLKATLQYHLDRYMNVEEECVRAIKNDFYVDDLVIGDQTEDKALTLHEKSNRILSEGGFQLRKWLSNSKRVQQIVEPKHAALHDERNFNDDESFAKASLGVRNDTQLEKVLGIDWNCVSDEFLIQFTTLTERTKSLVPTKRNILSILAGLYDPLGFVSPLVFTIKVLLQELWIEGFAWDDELDENRKRSWLGWIEKLERISLIAVPRFLLWAILW